MFTVASVSVAFYVHGTVHLSNTSHINTNEMQLFLFSLFGVRIRSYKIRLWLLENQN